MTIVVDMLITSTREDGKQDDDADDDDDDCKKRQALFLCFLCTELTRQAPDHHIDGCVDTAEIIILREIGDHIIAYNTSCISVVDACFQPVTGSDKCLSPAVAGFGLNQYHCTVILALLSDFPHLTKTE